MELDVILAKPVLEILRLRQASGRCDYVFPGRDGCANQHMTNPSIGWTRILKRAGIESLHMHDLRRNLASF